MSTILTTGSRNVAVDSVHGTLYYRDRRSNLDGSDEEVLPALAIPISPQDFALDVGGGKMYMAYLSGQIRRANLDGTGVEDLVVRPDDTDPQAIALDLNAGKVYWSESRDGPIQRANLDGTDVEPVIPATEHGYYSEVLARHIGSAGLAVDPEQGKLYFNREDVVRIANLDGTGVMDLAQPDISTRPVSHIALDLRADETPPPERVYVDAAATGDEGGDSWENAFTDLQDALIQVDCAGNPARAV